MTLPVRDFIIQRLLEYDPSFDVGAGVPTTSLLVDPLSIILQPVVDELTVIQATQSILAILESDDPDGFPEDIVDGLASNAFVERNVGAIGSDVVRVRFFQPQAFSFQKGVLIFRGPAAQRFTNSEAIAVTSAEMSLNQEGTLYYIDIPIIALEEGDGFNVAAGSITSMEAEPVGVANLSNLFGVDQGRNRETNTELIDRIKVAVTVRALVTGRGIIVTLTENFTTIEEIEPIGFGDPEMMRDIVYNVHIGGNVDVYVKTASLKDSSKDVFGLEVDASRRHAASATVVAKDEGVSYSLGHANIDRTSFAPIVKTIDNAFVYDEGPDYTIDDTTGGLARTPGSTIFHLVGSGGSVTDLKTLTKAAAFGSVRTGMVLTIDTPGTVAGTYTVKAATVNTITIYGEFPVASAVDVDYKVDDTLSISYEYNPVTIDIIKEPRADDRTDYTISEVPLMYIESIEVLDPLSGEPTGVTLSGLGGYGSGGYGMGGYGVGAGMEYQFVVTQSTLRHSEREDNFIEFAGSFVGVSVRVNYKHASAIPPIQAFMDDRNNQSETASLLARHFIPVYVDSSKPIIYDIPAATSATALSAEDMTEIVEGFIDDIDEGNPIELSDLVDVLYDNGATRVDLGTVKSLRGEIHNHDGSVIFTVPNEEGSIVIPEDEIEDPSDKPLSPRIARFQARNITLQRNVV